MSVTLEDIAEQTGVDKSTVSKILGGKARKARISRQREAYVMSVAEKLNFRPNAAARAMSEGRFGCVALLMSTGETSSTLPQHMLLGIHDALAKHDLHLTMTRLPDEQLTSEGFVPKILRQAMADGLLINYTDHIPQKMRDLMHRYRLPSIWLNSKQAADCAYPDDEDAGRRAVEYLLSRGCRRVAYVDYSHRIDDPIRMHYSAIDRRMGYERAMVAAGLQPRVIESPADFGVGMFEGLSRQWLQGSEPPDAVVAYSDHEVNPVLLAARDMRLDLPVVTFGNSLVVLGDCLIPTMIVPQSRLGRIAVEMLLEKMENPAEPMNPRPIPLPLALNTDMAADVLSAGD